VIIAQRVRHASGPPCRRFAPGYRHPEPHWRRTVRHHQHYVSRTVHRLVTLHQSAGMSVAMSALQLIAHVPRGKDILSTLPLLKSPFIFIFTFIWAGTVNLKDLQGVVPHVFCISSTAVFQAMCVRPALPRSTSLSTQRCEHKKCSLQRPWTHDNYHRFYCHVFFLSFKMRDLTLCLCPNQCMPASRVADG
jgi:hypothetical protein